MSEPDYLNEIADNADDNNTRVLVWALNENTRAIESLVEQQRIANMIQAHEALSRAEMVNEATHIWSAYIAPGLGLTTKEEA